MQCNEDHSQGSIACPTHNQCKIHEVYADRKSTRLNSSHRIASQTHNQCKVQEVFASRIQDPTRVQECSTQDSLATSKSTKNATK